VTWRDAATNPTAEELVTTDTLISNDVELVAALTTTVYNEEIVDNDTLANNEEKLVTANTLAYHDEEIATATTLANTKTHERGACREVPDREERRDSAQRQVQVATYTWINILKKICAKSKRIAAEVYSVELRSRSNVEQQEAGTTTLTNPQNTKNYVDVVSAKRTRVEEVAKTIIDTDTVAPKTETTNEFETKSCQDQHKQSTLSRTLTWSLWGKDKSVETAKTSIRTLCPN
jgi:hypothetical protein